MNITTKLMIRYARYVTYLYDCVAFRFEKERYTPYTMLSGEWYCPPDTEIAEIAMFQLTVNDKLIHMGYPTNCEIIKKDGRLVLRFTSNGYSAALTTNQCPDGLIPDVNLTGLVNKANFILPGIQYQEDTPVTNYVNYYNGTSLWDAIVIYSLRVGSKRYPYLSGHNLIRIGPTGDEKTFEITTPELISRSNKSDYTRLISKITMKDVDGTPGKYVLTNPYSTQRIIYKCREINFDREWIMDPQTCIRHILNYAMRKVDMDSFSFFGYTSLDLLDRISVTDTGFNGEVDRLIISASAEKGVVTTVWCYHDGYCA